MIKNEIKWSNTFAIIAIEELYTLDHDIGSLAP